VFGVSCAADGFAAFAAATAGLRPGERLVAKHEIGSLKARPRSITTIGPSFACGWGVHNNDIVNLERAVVERVFVVEGEVGTFSRPPLPSTNLKKALSKFTQCLFFHMPHVEPISMEQFIDNYVGRKRKMYERAFESLKLTPLMVKDSFISAFIKDEKTDFVKKPNACPRVIQPRSARFNITVGVFLRPFEKACFRAIAGVFKGVTVAKGLNAFDRGKLIAKKWKRFINPVGIMLDAKRFDQHCSRGIIEWKHMVEERVFPQLREYNNMRRKNKCFGRTHDGFIKYVVDGCTMSGDMDTASGNCLIMCAITWTVMRELGISRYEYVNDGDDGVLIVEKEDLELIRSNFQEQFLTFGFTMKWDGDVNELEQIEFCQSHPVFDGREWRMVRTVAVSLIKDSLTIKTIQNELHLLLLQNANGWCGLSLAGDMPVLGAFYKRLARFERPKIDARDFMEGKDYLALGLDPRRGEPTMEARLSFWRAFGISPDNQLAAEYHIDNLPLPEGIPTPGDLTDDTTIQTFLHENSYIPH
jgi:hypothetical protein